jgi:hypothetical protein
MKCNFPILTPYFQSSIPHELWQSNEKRFYSNRLKTRCRRL